MERIDKQNKSLRVPLLKQPFLGWTCSLIKPVLWRLVVRYQLRYLLVDASRTEKKLGGEHATLQVGILF